MTSTALSGSVTARSYCPAVPVRRRRSHAALRRRNRLVEAHRELVKPVAVHYARRCQESWDDLHQVGLLGLIRAAELYRRDLGTPFEAFARPHIRGAILHYLRDVAPAVRLPRRQAELQERLQRLETDLAAAEGANGAAAQLRDRLGVDEEHWRLLLRQRQLCRAIPLDEVRLDGLAAPPIAEVHQRHDALRELLQQLEPRQRDVVKSVVLEGCSYRLLASRMQVSAMTVQRLLHRGLAKLREGLEERELRTAQPVRRGGSGLRGY